MAKHYSKGKLRMLRNQVPISPCQKNFNPIDMVMIVKACHFREAVELIDGLQDR